MALTSYLVFFLISQQLLVSLSEEAFNPRCPSFHCGHLGNLGFPFSNRTHPECGLCIVDHCDKPLPRIQLGKDGPSYDVKNISQEDNTVHLRDKVFPHNSVDRNNLSCNLLKNLTLPSSPFISFEIPPPKGTLLKCPPTKVSTTPVLCNDSQVFCNDSSHSIIFCPHPDHELKFNPLKCSLVPILVNKTKKGVTLVNLFTGQFFLQLNVPRECYECHWRGGQCQSDNKGNFYCSNTRKGDQNLHFKLGLGIGIVVATLLVVVLSIYIIRHPNKGKYASPNLHSRYTCSEPSSKSNLEVSGVYFGVPIFSYSELAEATGNFNHENEVGDGGFGTVYHGTLKDGREVAVKRLYEHNYRRVEQFINEIEILTHLRHKNLVLLYGCTSRHSRGLLLVYEFIPNGTVADHLHGDRANPCLLTWPIRMNIAIETARALAYLHASNIIHRDMKTSNILLDNNFCVKVADFGLSRLFPTDATHVSTVPQGTAGYVDPEYYLCYRLTDKSDVYSFGVVLIELISSMPAVDISRHNQEINLANLAINRIQKRAVDELINPCLGFHSDEELKRMATSVAELAFLCLQQNMELRPSMDVVLEELQRIKSGECKLQNLKEEDDDDKQELKSMQQLLPSPPHSDEAALLKNIKPPPSPISVTQNWVSNNTTPNVSN